MDGLAKDFFIVHSQEDEREAALAGALIPRLVAVDIPVWIYEDWQWEHKVRHRGRGTYRSSGRPEELDLARLAEGYRDPFRAPIDEVDEGSLGAMLHDSKVVLLCEPRDGVPSQGVLKESHVLADLTAGPILVHLRWSDSPGEFFAKLRPTWEIRLAESRASVAVVDEVFAAVVSAWLVYTLQRRWGRAGGDRLLAEASRSDPVLKSLVERSPQCSDLEGPATVRTEAPATPDADVIREMFDHLGHFEEELLSVWRMEHVRKLSPHAEDLQGGGCACLLRRLLSACAADK